MAIGGVNASAGTDRERRHHAQMLAAVVARDVEVVELGAVVVADQAGHLLEVFRFELHDRRRAEAMRLLPPRDERLREQAADGLAAVEAQVAGPRAEAEHLVRPRRAQPLKVNRQLSASKSSRTGAEWLRLRRQTRRRRHVHVGIPCPSIVRSQPSSPQIIF